MTSRLVNFSDLNSSAVMRRGYLFAIFHIYNGYDSIQILFFILLELFYQFGSKVALFFIFYLFLSHFQVLGSFLRRTHTWYLRDKLSFVRSSLDMPHYHLFKYQPFVEVSTTEVFLLFSIGGNSKSLLGLGFFLSFLELRLSQFNRCNLEAGSEGYQVGAFLYHLFFLPPLYLIRLHIYYPFFYKAPHEYFLMLVGNQS